MNIILKTKKNKIIQQSQISSYKKIYKIFITYLCYFKSCIVNLFLKFLLYPVNPKF